MEQSLVKHNSINSLWPKNRERDDFNGEGVQELLTGISIGGAGIYPLWLGLNYRNNSMIAMMFTVYSSS